MTFSFMRVSVLSLSQSPDVVVLRGRCGAQTSPRGSGGKNPEEQRPLLLLVSHVSCPIYFVSMDTTGSETCSVCFTLISPLDWMSSWRSGVSLAPDWPDAPAVSVIVLITNCIYETLICISVKRGTWIRVYNINVDINMNKLLRINVHERCTDNQTLPGETEPGPNIWMGVALDMNTCKHSNRIRSQFLVLGSTDLHFHRRRA